MEHTLAEQIQLHAADIASATTADNKGDGHNDVVALIQWAKVSHGRCRRCLHDGGPLRPG